MLERYRKWKARQSIATKNEIANTMADSAIQLQRTYWNYTANEKAALVSQYPDSLTWSELLRLHHLTCLELLDTDEGRAQLAGGTTNTNFKAPKGLARDLCQELTQRLLSKESPYRLRHCAVWKGEAGQSEQRPPDLQGQLRNASLTHLGCLEVIRLGDQNRPQKLSFVPLDDVRGVLFAQPSLFRVAKVAYENARGEEVVLMPLLYGISWLTRNEFDHDGKMTRFCCGLEVEGSGVGFGIGVGHQDFLLTTPGDEGRGFVFGLGSVGKIVTAVELNDPRFEQKCRLRGLDPSAVKQQMTRKGEK